MFLLSGLLARAGMAGASGAEGAEAPEQEQPEPTEVNLAQTSDVAEVRDAETVERVAQTPASEPTTSWPARIDARLEALAARERPAQASDAGPDRRVRAALDRAMDELAGADRARVAVEVRDLDSGARLAAHDGDRLLNPASNQKLITAIAAVELLGPDYRFETELLREGDALILRGQGDPDLHVADLHALASAARRRPELLDGVSRILVDDGAFSARQLGPGFRSDGPGDSYMAPSGALALDFATVEISVAPGRFRAAPTVTVEPSGAAIEIVNEARTEAGRLRVHTEAGLEGRTRVVVRGAIAAGRAPVKLRRRVADPGLVAASSFAEILAAIAERPALPVGRGRASSEAELIARHRSAPLVEVLASALRFSNNFSAEQVLRTLAWRARGEPGSWAAGVELLARFAEAVSPEHGPRQRFVNGSGLSLDGRLSPAFVVEVLALSGEPSSPAQTLLASFAEAGGEGTLRNRLPGAGARVQAKTGTYAGASSLSGIVYDRRGERALGFSILVNGAELERAHAMQDRLVAGLLRAI